MSTRDTRTWWDFIHNCVAHPLMWWLPGPLTDRFHDWTAGKLPGGPE